MEMITDEFKQVYSGKNGCACGCNGKHYENGKDKNFKPMAKKILKVINDAKKNPESVSELDESTDYVAVVTHEDRLYVAYFKDGHHLNGTVECTGCHDTFSRMDMEVDHVNKDESHLICKMCNFEVELYDYRGI